MNFFCNEHNEHFFFAKNQLKNPKKGQNVFLVVFIRIIHFKINQKETKKKLHTPRKNAGRISGKNAKNRGAVSHNFWPKIFFALTAREPSTPAQFHHKTPTASPSAAPCWWLARNPAVRRWWCPSPRIQPLLPAGRWWEKVNFNGKSRMAVGRWVVVDLKTDSWPPFTWSLDKSVSIRLGEPKTARLLYVASQPVQQKNWHYPGETRQWNCIHLQTNE